MSKRKENLQKLNNSRNRAILRYINDLHNEVDTLYEALIDNEIEVAVIIQRKLTNKLRSLKIEEDKP